MKFWNFALHGKLIHFTTKTNYTRMKNGCRKIGDEKIGFKKYDRHAVNDVSACGNRVFYKKKGNC